MDLGKEWKVGYSITRAILPGSDPPRLKGKERGMSGAGRNNKWLRAPRLFCRSLGAALASAETEERNEMSTYDGGGGEAPLIRGDRFAFACPAEIDTPLDLNEMLLTDERRGRVVITVFCL